MGQINAVPLCGQPEAYCCSLTAAPVSEFPAETRLVHALCPQPAPERSKFIGEVKA